MLFELKTLNDDGKMYHISLIKFTQFFRFYKNIKISKY